MVIVESWGVPAQIAGNHQVDLFSLIDSLKPEQDGRHFADGIFKCIWLNEN